MLEPQNALFITESSNSVIMNALVQLSAEPIKIIDEQSAEERIRQWKEQESQCDKFMKTAESYNLLHLMSLVHIYDDLRVVGEKSLKGPKAVKMWVIAFMKSNLKINSKAEQRNRLGCDRLRKLFNEGITATQLANAGCRKCDFFVKKEYYEVFLSQIPSLEMWQSISSSSSNERLSEVLDLKHDEVVEASSSVCTKKRKVFFKLRLEDDLKTNNYENDEYII